MRAKLEQLKKKGQGLVEYALILVLIAIVVILILTFLGSQVNSTFSRISSGLGTP
jgi:pilus assembly protein Flp/PilA